jgi:hypothetical protein
VALADKGPDEAVTLLWEALPAERLAADDLEHRLAVVRATDHPSALTLAATIADFAASAGAESLSVNQCLQLKVSLARWRPPVWRTVLMPATANLAALHRAIQVLYGWDGDHLYASRVRRAAYSDPSFSLEETRDEYAMRVLAALNAGGGKITYEYDFDACWIHEIPAPAIRSASPTAGTHQMSTRMTRTSRSRTVRPGSGEPPPRRTTRALAAKHDEHPPDPEGTSLDGIRRAADRPVSLNSTAGRVAVTRRVCRSCPVRADCLTAALDADEAFGIWGGLGPKLRRKASRMLAARAESCDLPADATQVRITLGS